MKKVKLQCDRCQKLTFWDGKRNLKQQLIISPHTRSFTGCIHCRADIDVTDIINKSMDITGKSMEDIDNQWFDWLKTQNYEVIDDI